MQLKNLFADEDAVSPVIGVILMVAITVILAAVIGAFVLGIGGSQEQVPQASFEWSDDGTDTSVTHKGGDAIAESQLTFSPASGSCTFGSSGDFTAGDSKTCSGVTGSTVNLVWDSDSSDSSNIISTYEG